MRGFVLGPGPALIQNAPLVNALPIKLRFSWKALLAIGVSGVALWLVLRRIDGPELLKALRGASFNKEQLRHE